jgi:hypothetical protein
MTKEISGDAALTGTTRPEYTLRVVYQDGSFMDHTYPDSLGIEGGPLHQLTHRISWYAEGPHGHNEGYGGVISMHVTLSRPCQDWQRI